jgi:bifunctional DNase/RNase
MHALAASARGVKLEVEMIEVSIDSIRVHLVSQSRVVVLKELTADRYLPIWIGPFEADAIAMSLQDVEAARPMTHDLLKSVLHHLGAETVRIEIHDLRDDVFYARIIVRVDGREAEIDSRPSDALALAVRVHAPVFVEEGVMDRAGVVPEADAREGAPQAEGEPAESDDRLSVFKDFVEKLDLDDIHPNDKKS